MKHLLILCFWVITCSPAWAQVSHNYTVGPQNTNCDSLNLKDIDETEAMDLIRQSKFRFDQHFNIRRNSGLQAGYFYSCDNKSGFLIIRHDGKNHLFSRVPVEIWDELISSGDPDGVFEKKILPEYQYSPGK